MLTALHTTSSRPLSSSILFRRIPRSPVLLRRCASLVDWVRNASPAKHGWCSRSSLRLTRRTLCFGWGVRLRGVSPFVPSVIVVVLALALALVVALVVAVHSAVRTGVVVRFIRFAVCTKRTDREAIMGPGRLTRGYPIPWAASVRMWMSLRSYRRANARPSSSETVIVMALCRTSPVRLCHMLQVGSR